MTRVLPAENAETQTYRIKSKAEPFERSAKEYEIVAVEPAASEMADDLRRRARPLIAGIDDECLSAGAD